MINSQQSGFTLMEVLVVIGLFAILTTIGLFFSIDFFRTYSMSSQESSLISALSKSRARSLANINQNWHGVRISGNDYILFQGDNSLADWNHRDSSFDEPPVDIGVIVSSRDIIFDRLSGNATCTPDCNLGVSGFETNKVVTINQQGAIIW